MKLFELQFLGMMLVVILCAGCDEDSTGPQGQTSDLSIELAIHRMDGGSGAALVSSGIPLPPGALTVAAGTDLSSEVRLLINGEAQPVYAEALYGFHPDGSRRSILIQSTQTVTDGSPIDAVLEFGSNAATQAKTTIDWEFAQAVALPTSPEYLTSLNMVGPLITVAEASSLQLFADHDAAYVARMAQSPTDNDWHINYYDRVIAAYVYWMRSGDPWYWKEATRVARNYLSRYFDGEGSIQAEFTQPDGMYAHYLLTGDPLVRERVNWAANQRMAWMHPWGAWVGTDVWENEGRLVGRSMWIALYAWLLECPEPTQSSVSGRTWSEVLDEYVNVIYTFREPYHQNDPALDGSFYYELEESRINGEVGTGAYGQSNFMEALRMTALIRYYLTKSQDARIVEIVEDQVAFLWNEMWHDVPIEAFQYHSNDHDGSQTTPTESMAELNNLFVIAWGFLYNQTGNAAYVTQADQMMRAGIDKSWWTPNKAFNQNFSTSYNYLARRGAH